MGIPGGEGGLSGVVGLGWISDGVTGLLWLSHSAELRLVGSENIAGFKSRNPFSLLLSSWLTGSSTSRPPLLSSSFRRTGSVAITFFCFFYNWHSFKRAKTTDFVRVSLYER